MSYMSSRPLGATFTPENIRSELFGVFSTKGKIIIFLISHLNTYEWENSHLNNVCLDSSKAYSLFFQTRFNNVNYYLVKEK